MVTSVGFSVLTTRAEERYLPHNTTRPPISHEWHPTILTQTAIWHVTVRGSNATADRCTLAHYATSVGNITPQWQPSASARWVARTQAANPVPPPQPTRSPNPSSVRKHLLSPLYHFHIVDLLVVDSYICSCHSCIVIPPLCCALMTFAAPCTTPQTHPTKLALGKGEDDRSQVRRPEEPRLCVCVCVCVHSQAPSSS